MNSWTKPVEVVEAGKGMSEPSMNRSGLFTILSACVCAFGSSVATAQTIDSGVPKPPVEYQAMKENCTGMGDAGQDLCLKQAKDKHSARRCEDSARREERECVIREFDRQHVDIIDAGQRQRAAPVSSQPK